MNSPEKVLRAVCKAVTKICNDTNYQMRNGKWIAHPNVDALKLFGAIEKFTELTTSIGEDAKTLSKMFGFIDQYNLAYINMSVGEPFSISLKSGDVNYDVKFRLLDSRYYMSGISVDGVDITLLVNADKIFMNAMNDVELTVSNDLYNIYEHVTPDITVSITELHAGKSTRGHKHSHWETYTFSEAGLVLSLDDVPTEIDKPNTFRVAGGVHHRVSNPTNKSIKFACFWFNKDVAQ